MKIALIAAVSLLASCKDNRREPPQASSPGPGAPAAPAPGAAPAGAATTGAMTPAAPALDVCRISLDALDRATCPTPDGRASILDVKRSVQGAIDAIRKVGGADSLQFQAVCAQLLLAIESDATKLKCAVALDARHRAEINAMLDGWYGQRTPVVPTGDPAADAVIARIAAVRDATCECRDGACLDRMTKQLQAVGAMPGSAPDAARTLGNKLLEDAGRCASRARLNDRLR